MATSRMNDLKLSVEMLPIYDGTSKKHLSTFVKQVDRLMGFVNTLVPPISDFENFAVTNGIISKIRGKALDSLDNTDTTNWQYIKNTLLGQHLIFKTYATIFNEIININKRDPYELYDIIYEKSKEFKDLITNEFPTDKNIITVFEKIIIQNYINKVSEPYASNLANRQPQTLNELGNLLQNDYQFLKYKQVKPIQPFERKLPSMSPQQFSRTSFPVGPIQTTNFNVQRRNFAPRQNVINRQKQEKPIPMSTQTRMTNKSNINTPDNYFTRQNRQFGTNEPNYTAEEIHNQELAEYENERDNFESLKNENETDQNSFLEFGGSDESQEK